MNITEQPECIEKLIPFKTEDILRQNTKAFKTYIFIKTEFDTLMVSMISGFPVGQSWQHAFKFISTGVPVPDVSLQRQPGIEIEQESRL